jgi:hypothetical protein
MIEDFAFCGCSGLSSATFPAGLEWIGNSAFQGCSALRSVDIPASVVELESGTFKDCSELESVVFLEPSRLEKIQPGCFEGCG